MPGSAMNVDINEPRRNNQIGKIGLLRARRDLQTALRAQTLDRPILDHN